jgi:hypothetical protein
MPVSKCSIYFALLDVNSLEDVSKLSFFAAAATAAQTAAKRTRFLILQGIVQSNVVQGVTLAKDTLTSNPG